MIKTLRTDSSNKDFIALVKLLDAELAIRDGDDHAFYSQFNNIDALKYVIVLYEDAVPIGCGSVKPYNDNTLEVKRMFTSVEHRGKGVASKILEELERWAIELDCGKCLLETGVRQHEAIALYKKCGYHQVPNYEQYEGVEDSVCFEKSLIG